LDREIGDQELDHVKPRPLLQVALDVLSTRRALEIATQIYPYVDIFEIGTPLVIEEGLSALEALKAKFPDKRFLADLKIMDAGKMEASSAFRRGADIVTALAAADDRTLRGALVAAEEHGGQLMVDCLNVRDVASRARELAAMDVPIICLHTASDLTGGGSNSLQDLDTVRPLVSCQLAIAGGLAPDTMRRAVAKGADIVVIGSGITQQHDPGATARAVMHELEKLPHPA